MYTLALSNADMSKPVPLSPFALYLITAHARAYFNHLELPQLKLNNNTWGSVFALQYASAQKTEETHTATRLAAQIRTVETVFTSARVIIGETQQRELARNEFLTVNNNKQETSMRPARVCIKNQTS